MQIIQYVIGRFFVALATMFGVSIVIFAAVRMVPGGVRTGRAWPISDAKVSCCYHCEVRTRPLDYRAVWPLACCGSTRRLRDIYGHPDISDPRVDQTRAGHDPTRIDVSGYGAFCWVAAGGHLQD